LVLIKSFLGGPGGRFFKKAHNDRGQAEKTSFRISNRFKRYNNEVIHIKTKSLQIALPAT